MALIRPAGEPVVYARSVLPRFSMCLDRFIWEHATAGKLVGEAAVTLVARSLLAALAGLQANGVLHK